MKTRERSFNSM